MIKKGFTIIETLVAITILMVAISGPLTVSFKGLTAAIGARDQMVANFLAQEGIEYFRWLKDDNIKNPTAGTYWLEGLYNCEEDNACGFDLWDGVNIGEFCVSDNNDACKLYYNDTDKQYERKPSGNRETSFYRKVYIKDQIGGSLGVPASATLVTEVWWDTGSVTDNRIILETRIFDVQK